jgi:predicted RNase H-like HicB family nuclease
MRQYIGLVHKEAASAYGVSFADFPGVVTAGATLDEARAMAQEALAFHIEGLAADGGVIPEPSDFEEVMADPVNQAARPGDGCGPIRARHRRRGGEVEADHLGVRGQGLELGVSV